MEDTGEENTSDRVRFKSAERDLVSAGRRDHGSEGTGQGGGARSRQSAKATCHASH